MYSKVVFHFPFACKIVGYGGQARYETGMWKKECIIVQKGKTVNAALIFPEGEIEKLQEEITSYLIRDRKINVLTDAQFEVEVGQPKLESASDAESLLESGSGVEEESFFDENRGSKSVN